MKTQGPSGSDVVETGLFSPPLRKSTARTVRWTDVQLRGVTLQAVQDKKARPWRRKKRTAQIRALRVEITSDGSGAWNADWEHGKKRDMLVAGIAEHHIHTLHRCSGFFKGVFLCRKPFWHVRPLSRCGSVACASQKKDISGCK